MKKETDNNAWIRFVFIVFAIAYGIASNDDFETAQRVRVAYHVK